MHIMYFTERPYREVPEDEVIKNRSFFGVPNSFFDREVGSRLYNEYLDEAVYAEEMGFDGVMLNEHHGTPFCMGAVMNVEAAILARITKKVRIVLLGNPLPIVKKSAPHGGGTGGDRSYLEGPAGSRMGPRRRQRTDLQQRQPGLQSRVFQRGARPRDRGMDASGAVSLGRQAFHLSLRQPVGAAVSEAAPADMDSRRDQRRDRGLVRAASLSIHRAGHRAAIDRRVVESVRRHRDAGRLSWPGSENFGYLQQIHRRRDRGRRRRSWARPRCSAAAPRTSRVPNGLCRRATTPRRQRGVSRGRPPTTAFSASLSEKLKERCGDDQCTGEDTRGKLRRGEVSIEEAKRKIYGNYQKAQDGLQIIIGTPKTVIPKLRLIMEVLRPGVFGLFQAQGPLTLEQRMTSMRLMGQEVLPAMREIAKELGIVDPFEREPGSRPHTAGTQRDSLVDLERAQARAASATNRYAYSYRGSKWNLE